MMPFSSSQRAGHPFRRVDAVALLEHIYAPQADWDRWGVAVLSTIESGLARARPMLLTVFAHGEDLTPLRPLRTIFTQPMPL